MHAAHKLLTIAVSSGLILACGEDDGLKRSDEHGPPHEDAIDVSMHPLVNGTWADSFNGSVAPDAIHYDGVFVCAALHAGDYHPGKVGGGLCYYGWGGREYYQAAYRTLVGQPSYHWVVNPGHTPPNAVVGPIPGSVQLPVCASHDGRPATGKVWKGECHYGYGGREVRTPHFSFLVDG